METNQRKPTGSGFILQTLHSNVPNQRLEAVPATLKPRTNATQQPPQDDSAATTIADLKEQLRLATKTNLELTHGFNSTNVKLIKLTNAKSHLIRQLRASRATTTEPTVCDALTEQLQTLQLEHDALAIKYHSAKKQHTNMTVRSRQVSELQSEVQQLRRVRALQAQLLDLFRELGRSRHADHSRYSPIGKAIRQAEQDLAAALDDE